MPQTSRRALLFVVGAAIMHELSRQSAAEIIQQQVNSTAWRASPARMVEIVGARFRALERAFVLF